MSDPNQEDLSPGSPERPKWPWWEPYVFTAFVIVGLVIFSMVCGWINRIPLIEHMLLGAMTVAALFDFFRKPGELPSVGGKLGSTLFFGFISGLYFFGGKWFPGAAYSVMSAIWFVLLILAIGERRRIRQETLRKLDKAIESLRDANLSP